VDDKRFTSRDPAILHSFLFEVHLLLFREHFIPAFGLSCPLHLRW